MKMRIGALMDTLGVGRQYRGYAMSVDAVCCVMENEEQLRNVRELVLEPLAEKYCCRWECVGRNIRTVIRRCWQTNPAKLQQMAAYPLTGEPTVSEFLWIVTAYVQRVEEGWERSKGRL